MKGRLDYQQRPWEPTEGEGRCGPKARIRTWQEVEPLYRGVLIHTYYQCLECGDTWRDTWRHGSGGGRTSPFRTTPASVRSAGELFPRSRSGRGEGTPESSVAGAAGDAQGSDPSSGSYEEDDDDEEEIS